MFTGSIEILNPLASKIQEIGEEFILESTDKLQNPFLHLLSGRWLSVAAHDPLGRTTTIEDPASASADLVVSHDWLIDFLVKEQGETGLKNCKSPIMRFRDLPAFDRPNYINGAMNWFMTQPEIDFKITSQDIWHISELPNLSPSGRLPPVIVPFGCPMSWVPSTEHANRVIFLDELYPSVMDGLEKGTSRRSRLFLHAIQVSKILSQRGFRVLSFCRFNDKIADNLAQTYPHVEVLSVGKWVAFAQLMRDYAKASLFFSFVHETHGYALYENLQIGNGIIAYSENVDAYRFRQLQNTALLSVFMSPVLCADLICEFFTRFELLGLREQIRNEAREKFSCETFIHRLRKALSEKNLREGIVLPDGE